MKGTNYELTDNQLGVVTGGYSVMPTWGGFPQMPKEKKPIVLKEGPICQQPGPEWVIYRSALKS